MCTGSGPARKCFCGVAESRRVFGNEPTAERIGMSWFHQVHSATSPTSTTELRPQAAGQLGRNFDEAIELRRTVFKIVAARCVRFHHEVPIPTQVIRFFEP